MGTTHYHQQAWLDFGLSLPEGASDEVLWHALKTQWRNSGGLAPSTMVARVSDLRLLVARSTRRHRTAIDAHVAKWFQVGTSKWTHEWLKAARRVRKHGRSAL